MIFALDLNCEHLHSYVSRPANASIEMTSARLRRWMSQTAVGTNCIHIEVQNRSVCDVCVIIEIGMVKEWSDREGMRSYLV